jgi:hypothetical protein
LLLVRRHPLDIVAAISLVALGILLCGYVASFRAVCVEGTGLRFVFVQAHRGSFAVGWGSGSVTASQGYRLQLGSLDILTFFVWAWPDAPHALGPFAAASMPDGTSYIIVPLWCLILPCMIAPVLWLRRRRRTARGFAVEPAHAAVIG